VLEKIIPEHFCLSLKATEYSCEAASFAEHNFHAIQYRTAFACQESLSFSSTFFADEPA
jgi:hypothetical protein